jgi:hypothetical protein
MGRAVYGVNLVGTKTCSRCAAVKPYAEFDRRANRTKGLAPWCKACEAVRRSNRIVEQKHEDYEKHRAKLLIAYRLKSYGISGEQYEEMLARQNGVCAICGNPETARNKRGETRQLAVEHDHETNAVRDLLCAACNCALGYMRDDPKRLSAAAAYLMRWQS